MPYSVNGQVVTEERIRAEEERIRHDPRWGNIAAEAERAKSMRAAAEFSAIDVVLVEQAAANDPRPVDPLVVEREMQVQRAMGNCRTPEAERRLRMWIDWNLRLQRTAREMTAGARRPSAATIEAFYIANRSNFSSPALFRAAHIVKHIDEQQSEDQARRGIEVAVSQPAAVW